jgi:hypothetical protein
MKRSYFSARFADLLNYDPMVIVGQLTHELPFAAEPTQIDAWRYQIAHLKKIAPHFPNAHVFFEFSIPRMGRRADIVLLINGIIFVIEYKVGSPGHFRADIDQTVGYALDLANFHETSHNRPIVPILVATESNDTNIPTKSHVSNVFPVVLTDDDGLLDVLHFFQKTVHVAYLNPQVWVDGKYKPTPTIVEAAQALYRGHKVEDISQNEAGADNLAQTHQYINQVIQNSQNNQQKSICFITGVPGSGKTLAGLNIATSRSSIKDNGHAVFLSGNGPLVTVLREALSQDRLEQQRQQPGLARTSRTEIETETHAFIQNIHHFRDEYVKTDTAPADRIVIFDESQRAWDQTQASRFMLKRGINDFKMSEPEFLLSVMNRHAGWATVICLVGGGQEINTGEAGISEWLRVLHDKFPDWKVHVSTNLCGPEYVRDDESTLLNRANVINASKLHLDVSRRSFRAENLSQCIGALISNDAATARLFKDALSQYPLYVTRSLSAARSWLRNQRRGQERNGLLASSNALRLKPDGIFVKSAVDPAQWFLAPAHDVRSSCALEDAASEFDVQGLELDWTCVCWDANLRREGNEWAGYNFKGTKWQRINQEDRRNFLMNSYRVLLTRARQGMVIFVPHGDLHDDTRLPALYDPIFNFLTSLGIPELPQQVLAVRRDSPVNETELLA